MRVERKSTTALQNQIFDNDNTGTKGNGNRVECRQYTKMHAGQCWLHDKGKGGSKDKLYALLSDMLKKSQSDDGPDWASKIKMSTNEHMYSTSLATHNKPTKIVRTTTSVLTRVV